MSLLAPIAGLTGLPNREIRRSLGRHPNVRLAGDIRYEKLPQKVAGWDVGWVPHRVGDGEVGGDVIKTYEYRAAGLPVVSTPIIGADRALPGVVIAADINGSVDAIEESLALGQDERPARKPIKLDPSMTWKIKSMRIMELLQI